MAKGQYKLMIAFLLLSCLASTRSAPSHNNTNNLSGRKKIFITADQMDVIISSNQETKVILEKLETVSAENKELAKKVQSLEKRFLSLEGRGKNFFKDLFLSFRTANWIS